MENEEIREEIKMIKTNMLRLFRALSPIAGDRGSFDLMCFEMRISEEQETWLLDLMDEIRKKLAAGEEYTYTQFEIAINNQYGWSYQLAKSIILSLNDERRYSEIHDEFKNQGMNI